MFKIIKTYFFHKNNYIITLRAKLWSKLRATYEQFKIRISNSFFRIITFLIRKKVLFVIKQKKGHQSIPFV